MASEFPPTAVTGDYSGAVTAIDEMPPAGGGAGEQIQVQRNNGATATETISFDLSTADEFREIHLLIRDLTSNGAGTGWQRSFQLVVNSVDVGSPIVESITATAFRYSRVRWPSSVDASVAANPSLVQVRIDSVNNTGNNNVQHRIDMARMYTSPFSAAQDPWGIPSADYIEAWDALWTQNELTFFADGGTLDIIPALKGGDHLVRTNTGSVTFDDDGAVLPAAFLPASARFTTQLPADYTDWKQVAIVRTSASPSTSDSDSEVYITGSSGWHVGAATSNKVLIPALAANNTTTGGSWIFMLGAGAPNDHIRGSVAIPSSTEFVVATSVDSGGDDTVWICDGGIFADDATIAVSGQSPTGDNVLRTLDIFARESNDRFWDGQVAAIYLFPGDTTEEELFAFAQTIGEEYGILDAEVDDVLQLYGHAEETDTPMSFAADSQLLDIYGFAAESDSAMPFVGVAAMAPPSGGGGGEPCRHRREFSRFNRCRCCSCGTASVGSS